MLISVWALRVKMSHLNYTSKTRLIIMVSGLSQTFQGTTLSLLYEFTIPLSSTMIKYQQGGLICMYLITVMRFRDQTMTATLQYFTCTCQYKVSLIMW